ncbi:MAG: peptidase [Euryarchaeota archaeon]|nr:peptidase [Euryarchaeota archaeon]
MISQLITFSGCIKKADDQITIPSEPLNTSNVTTKWDLSFLFNSRVEADKEVMRLVKIEFELEDKYINNYFRPQFQTLKGEVLLEYLEEEEEYLESFEALWQYAIAQHSLNVNDPYFNNLLSDMQDLSTKHDEATSFVEVKLTSISEDEWDRICSEEPGLEKYRPYLESNYIRHKDHRPHNENHNAYLTEIINQLMKLETIAITEITNNVTKPGNITLDNGEEYAINSQSYFSLLYTDNNRNNREKCYNKRFYHLINESDKMAQLYNEKSKLDDLYARELNYTDAFGAKLFYSYLEKEQIDDMNSVFKKRKNVFDEYFEFKRNKLGFDQLKPYDICLQLSKEPDQYCNYTDALLDIQQSYLSMDPEFNRIFIQTVTGNFIDVYPNPENGKQLGGYCFAPCKKEAFPLIFLNYNGLISDKKSITRKMGYGFYFYLMYNNVDYLYCDGTTYEMEIPSTFNEELFIDYIINNKSNETVVSMLSQHIEDYYSYFTTQPLITEFEYEAHILCSKQDNVSGADLNSLWTNLSKEYRNDVIIFYDEDSAEWIYYYHIYFTDNYYTYNYAISKAITLSLFKQYKENPQKFNKNYLEYLKAGTTITPQEKLKKYFNIEIDEKLFEDAMDVVESRINTLIELEKETVE